MDNPFHQLPKEANKDTIIRLAYTALQERNPTAIFNAVHNLIDHRGFHIYEAEVLSLAEEAMEVGFSEFGGWTKEQIASNMRDGIRSAYGAAQMQAEIEYRKNDPNYPDWYS